MIKWLKRNTAKQSSDDTIAKSVEQNKAEVVAPAPTPQEKPGLFSRFKKGLSKTRHQLGEGISRLLQGKKEIDATLLEELETVLLRADIGIETSQALMKKVSEELARSELADGDAVMKALKNEMLSMLNKPANTLQLETPDKSPFVILMVGVNGAGKTTTIGKLAKQFQQQGKKVMLAAGDTFRAAAVEQLQAWGERNKIPVVAQHTGADSASVIFDALQAAKARGMDILIADTAGRLHTQHNLMDELKKVKRVLSKIDSAAPHETMLVLDSSIGQNALNQAKQFHEAMGLSGITMTKLDGTAKGGILFAIAKQLDIPFRYLGIGEGVDDLQPFDALQFVDAIFYDDNIQSS